MARMPGAKFRKVGNYTAGGTKEYRGLVLHVQEGNNSPFGWFNNPDAQSSSTFWVGKTGTIEQFVDTADKAWAQMGGNAYYASVETEGYAKDALTDAQIEGVAKVYAWGHKEHGWPLVVVDSTTEHGLTFHGVGGAAWGGHYDCPGPQRKAQRARIMGRARELVAPPAPATPLVEVHNVQPGDVNGDVKVLQKALNAEYPKRTPLVADGNSGPKTQAAYKQWQLDCGVTGPDANGVPGIGTLTKLGKKHGFRTAV